MSKVRLKNLEIETIKDQLQKQIPCSFEVLLFGSRADLNKKGGDIDLLVLVSEENRKFLEKKYWKLKGILSESLGEQKVDLLIESSESIQRDEFLKGVLASAVRI